jgi:hypothetical protein
VAVVGQGTLSEERFVLVCVLDGHRTDKAVSIVHDRLVDLYKTALGQIDLSPADAWK